MKKLMLGILSVILIFALTACGGQPSSPASDPPAGTDLPADGPAENPDAGDLQPGGEDATEPPDGEDAAESVGEQQQLTADFFVRATAFMRSFGAVAVDSRSLDLTLGDGSEFLDGLWHFVYFDLYASEDGHPSVYDFAQYYQENAPGGGDRFDIPADQYVQAMKSWYGYDFDLSTLQTMTASEFETATPKMPRVAYDPDADLVYVGINGMGGDTISVIETPEISRSGREVTAVIPVTQYDQPLNEYTITIQENEDGTYTLSNIVVQSPS